MKEFKLKRWYPSLPKDWKHQENIVVVERSSSFIALHPSLMNTLPYTELTPHEVRDTEFWEEIKEKEFEILSLQNEFAHPSVIRGKKEINAWENGAKGNWTIHSIKRLSDGEVFTLEDKIKAVGNTGTITSFGTDDNCIIGFTVYSVEGTKKIASRLDIIEKLPKALFITEDGKGVYEGFTVYQVSVVDKKYGMHSVSARKGITPVPSYFKYFSTKEAAERYIIDNKPVFSLQDIKEIINDLGSNIIDVGFHVTIENKAKEKVGL